MKLKNRVALRIRTIRKQRKLTQGQLAERIDRTVFAVSQLERGLSLPSFETLERLSQALDVPVRDFFDQAAREAEGSPRRSRLMTGSIDLLRHLSDDELEVAAQLIQVIHASSKRRGRQGRGR